MKTKVKNIYYCDFCKKKGMQKPKMIEHELHCTLNRNRDCRLCKNENLSEVTKYYTLIPGMKREYIDSEEFIKELIDKIYCPNCILTILRCNSISNFHFDYKDRLKKYWYDQQPEESIY